MTDYLLTCSSPGKNGPILLFIIILFLSACTPQKDSELRIGTNHWPGYEPLYLAEELGYLDGYPIRLFELPSATEVFRAFKRRQINVAALTLDEALQLAQTEKDLRIFLILDISNGADKVMARAPITQPAQIKGQCIIAENTALGAFMLYQLLQAARLTAKDISIQTTTVDQHIKEAEKGNCPVVITFEPTASKLAKQNFINIFDSSQIPGKIVDVLVSRQSTLKQARPALEHLVAAHWKTLQYMQTRQSSAYQFIAYRLNLSPDDLAQSYQGLILPNRTHNQQLLNTSTNTEHGLLTTAYKMRDIMLEAHLLNHQPDIEYLITDELVQSP